MHPPLMAEALGLREAASLGKNLHKVILESDNQVLVDTCRGNRIYAEIGGIVEDINNIRTRFEASGITWVAHRGNESAHVIAYLAIRGDLLENWTRNSSNALRSTVFVSVNSVSESMVLPRGFGRTTV